MQRTVLAMKTPAPTLAAARAELDELTVARARRGNDSACRDLVVCYQRRVFALLGRLLGPAGLDDAVEDLAQETFLRVFRALPDFRDDGPARLSTWILTIASRLAIDRLRRSGRVTVPLDHPTARALPARGSTDAAAVGRALVAAIADLPPEFRVVFELRVGQDLDHAEIAAALDLPTGTVKSRLSRARARLRAALTGRPADVR